MYKTLSVGEVLWDVFPDYKKPGGSPANVAYHLHCLGNQSLLLSRIGTDENGDKLLEFLKKKGISTRYIQRDESLPTGIVTVKFDKGEPTYTIHQPSAWDAISLNDVLVNESNSLDAICFASLSQRHSTSAKTIQKLLTTVPDKFLKVFDLNLRPPFIDKEIILEGIRLADVIKINEDEYKKLSGWLNSEQIAENFINEDPSKVILLTEGEKGSSMFTSEGFFNEKAYPVSEEGDFVGVGDAFLACFTHLKLQQTPAYRILSLANRYAAFVASQRGGMPDITRDILQEIDQKNNFDL